MTPPHPLQEWLDLAFDRAEGPHASAAIAHHRDQRTAAGHEARSYEVVVPDPCPPVVDFLATLCPKLTYHLESLGMSILGAPGVFLSVFVGNRLYFIESVETLRLHRRLTPPPALPGR